MRVAHERTDAMHTAGRIELIHRTSIHSRHGLPAASIPAAGPRSRRLHDIPTLREMQDSRNDFRTTALTDPPPERRCMGSPYSTMCALQFFRPLTRRPATRSKTVTRRHNADLPTCTGALRGLGRVVADVGHDLGPDLRLMASDARRFDLAPFWRHDWSARGAFPASR